MVSSTNIANALFHLSTQPTIPAAIANHLSLVPGFDQYVSVFQQGDPVQRAEALCRMACSKTFIKNLRDYKGLEDLLGHIRVTPSPSTAQVQTDMMDWQQFRRTVPSIHPRSGLERLSYIGGALAKPAFWGGALEAGIHAALGTMPTMTETVVLGLLLALKVMSSRQSDIGIDILLDRATQRTLTPRDLEAFYAQFAKIPGLKSQVQDDPNPAQTIAAQIASCPHSDAKAYISHPRLWEGAIEFLRLGTVSTQSLQVDKTGALISHEAPVTCLGILNSLGANISLLQRERLDEIEELKRQGMALVASTNHRSYLDILATMALVGENDPRIVAKHLLLLMPILGFTPMHHPFQPWKWMDDGLLKAMRHILINRGDKEQARKVMNEDALITIKEGKILVVYPEGTRIPTPNRRYEWGIQAFKDGLFHSACMAANDSDTPVYHIPMQLYGLGLIMPKHVSQILNGAMIHQDVRFHVGKPIRVPKDYDPKRLRRRSWAVTWLGYDPEDENGSDRDKEYGLAAIQRHASQRVTLF